MKKENRFACLDGTMLKLIAMVSMVFDHVGDNFFPGQTWMRIIGRIAMPIFAFFIAEGFMHTRDRKKYLLRMGLFALVSELPFDLLTEGSVNFGHQNVMCTFFLAILALTAYERIVRDNRTPGRIALGIGAVLLLMALALLLRTDYSLYGVGLVFLFYVLRERELWLRNLAGMGFHLLTRNVGIHLFGLLGFLPLFLYNGKKGRGLKWLFYVFYPGHLLLLWLLKLALR